MTINKIHEICDKHGVLYKHKFVQLINEGQINDHHFGKLLVTHPDYKAALKELLAAMSEPLLHEYST